MPLERRADLPTPSTEEAAHSARLAQAIRDEIARAGGAIPFSRFMERCLYAPGLGYYVAGKSVLGGAGDFVTAPELGPSFARALARQVAQVLATLRDAEILEIGAGSGALAAELLLELERLRSLPRAYRILEISPALRARQDATLATRAPALKARVHWIDALPARGVRGVVIGNEVLDAMPVERIGVGEIGAVRWCVGDEGGRFEWRARPAQGEIERRVEALRLSAPYTSELGLAAEGFVRSLADVLEMGIAFFIDYGFPRAEFYHPQRREGTLMCHYRHRAHADPLILPGLQDITAHVDFTAIADAAHEAGLRVLGYTSQAAFLLAAGITESEQDRDPAARLARGNEIKKLTLPSEMGELFKVIALGRGVDAPLLGFQQHDRRGRL